MTEALQFLKKHRLSGALIDANVLLVYAVGLYDRNCLRYYRHTKQFAGTFQLISRLIAYFPVIYTTPHILTEVSNLGGKLPSAFLSTLKPLILRCTEQSCPSRDAVHHTAFTTLGLTDAAILTRADNRYVTITADWPLYQLLRHNDIDAINIYLLIPIDWFAPLSSAT